MATNFTQSTPAQKPNKQPGGAIIAGILPVMCLLVSVIIWLFITQQYVLATLLAVAVLLLFSVLVFSGYTSDWFEWIGVIEYGLLGKSYRRSKTLWDWLQLLIIPLVLSAGAIGFSMQQNQANLQFSTNQATIAQKQRNTDLTIAEQQRQADLLQTYLDRISDLLLNPKVHSRGQQGDDVRILARARTLTVLQNLQQPGKVTVLNFLIYGGLVKRLDPTSPNIDPIVNLNGADFSGLTLSRVELGGAALMIVNFSGTTLSGADLSASYLAKTDLRKANLHQALLCKAQLIGAPGETASLSGADLHDAHLGGADLIGVDLSGANLNGANLGTNDAVCKGRLKAMQLDGVDLSNAHLNGADLSNADLTGVRLAGADLTGVKWANTTCPDGTKSNKSASGSCADHLI